MQSLTLPAYAKVNLTLDVLHKRNDGYHELASIMQTVSLFDRLTFRRADGISLVCSEPDLPAGPGNLAYEAARMLLEYCGIENGVEIRLEKNIPVGAGLGGGSADAAAVFLGLNYLLDLKLTIGELVDLGSALGSDIPFCLVGGTALAEGRGEKLSLLSCFPKSSFLLIKPAFAISTAEVYKNLDCRKISPQQRPNTSRALAALEGKEEHLFIPEMKNVLEEPVFTLYPELRELKLNLLADGARAAVLCGSGSAFFALTSSLYEAQRLARKYRKMYKEVFVVSTV